VSMSNAHHLPINTVMILYHREKERMGLFEQPVGAIN